MASNFGVLAFGCSTDTKTYDSDLHTCLSLLQSVYHEPHTVKTEMSAAQTKGFDSIIV